MNRIVTGLVAAGIAVTVSTLAAGVASAAAPTADSADLGASHWATITMQLNNNTDDPLTLYRDAHYWGSDNAGHWQQQPPATLAPNSSVTVTAYTDSTLGFAIEADYTSPSGNGVTFQAVDYEAATDNWGFTGTSDPTLEVGRYIDGEGTSPHMWCEYTVWPAGTPI